jgi:hypothetical protein
MTAKPDQPELQIFDRIREIVEEGGILHAQGGELEVANTMMLNQTIQEDLRIQMSNVLPAWILP